MSVSDIRRLIDEADRALRAGRIAVCDHVLDDLETADTIGKMCAHHPPGILCPRCFAEHQQELHPTRCVACPETTTDVWEYVPRERNLALKVGEHRLAVELSGGELCASCHEAVVEA